MSKRIIMVCDCCKKEFVTEYWEGGYIDHVVNFVGNSYIFANRSNPVEEITKAIIFDGNDIRSTHNINDFLNCAMTWDCLSDEVKGEIKAVVLSMLSALKKAESEVNHVMETVSPIALAMLRRETISDSYWDTFYEVLQDKE